MAYASSSRFANSPLIVFNRSFSSFLSESPSFKLAIFSLIFAYWSKRFSLPSISFIVLDNSLTLAAASLEFEAILPSNPITPDITTLNPIDIALFKAIVPAFIRANCLVALASSLLLILIFCVLSAIAVEFSLFALTFSLNACISVFNSADFLSSSLVLDLRLPERLSSPLPNLDNPQGKLYPNAVANSVVFAANSLPFPLNIVNAPVTVASNTGKFPNVPARLLYELNKEFNTSNDPLTALESIRS